VCAQTAAGRRPRAGGAAEPPTRGWERMSLVGSLEDLGLADILQIMSLSRKSGVLLLCCDDGEGRIVFREGLVHAALVKGEAGDLDTLLRRAGVASGGGASASQLESARREHVERVIARMFEWRTGEFRFAVQDEIAPEDRELALAAGLSPQYLTMEATRRGDELRAGSDERGLDPPLVFSGDEDGCARATAEASEVVVAAVVARAAASADDPEQGAPAGLPGAPGARAVCSQAVIIDPELAALEWLKSSLSDLFARIHLFQTAESAIPRIRQYLMRGEVPAVLLSPRAPMDPLSGIDRPADLLRRLRALAPRMPLLLVAEPGSAPPGEAKLADAVLARPAAAALVQRGGEAARAAAAQALRELVAPFAERPGAGRPG